jgi:hypothetical protein
MAKHSSHILELARKGANHRYQELKAEIAALVQHFPHLGTSLGGRRPKGAQSSAGQPSGAESSAGPAEVAVSRTRKRRKMSAAARKKISDAQKARWARQKGKG